MPTSQLPLLAWKSRKKITHLPLPHWYSTAVEERLNCFTILYFHFPHLTSSSAILILACVREDGLTFFPAFDPLLYRNLAHQSLVVILRQKKDKSLGAYISTMRHV